MTTISKKNFQNPDESATPAETVTVETIKFGDVMVQKVTAKPGWVWTKDLAPIMKTETCQRHHLIYMLSGRLASRMIDGAELEFAAGDIGDIPPGHDGWTVGDEPAVWLEMPTK